jgi:hypothetical protein
MSIFSLINKNLANKLLIGLMVIDPEFNRKYYGLILYGPDTGDGIKKSCKQIS